MRLHWERQMYWRHWQGCSFLRTDEGGYYSNWLYIGPLQAHWYGTRLGMLAGTRFYRWLMRIAMPTYDCEDCIGMIEHGCQCAYYGAIAPGIGPERWRAWLQKWVRD